MARIRAFVVAHKFWAAIIAIAILWFGYYIYGRVTAAPTATHYVTTTVSTSTVVASITETGQVSASSNVDVQAKSGGEVLSLLVTAGQHVSAGAALASIDPTTAQQNVTSAKQSLQAAQIALANAEQNLSQAHATGYRDVATAFLTLPSVMNGLDGVLHSYTVPGHGAEENLNAYAGIAQAHGTSLDQYRDLTQSDYERANAAYQHALTDFKNTPSNADSATIARLVSESALAVADITEALRAATNLLDSVNAILLQSDVTPPAILAMHTSTLAGYAATVSGFATTLSNDASSVSPPNDVPGADPLNIQSNKLTVAEKEQALAVAQLALADTTVRAPFSGTVGKINVQQYQTISSGTSVATLVSDNQSVSISVNEVDAAKLKVGQKATITFDALPNVSIAGTVSSANTIGTITSGVVSYSATVTFDTRNTAVLPGMSATVDIVTGTETGLALPASAIKTINGQSYVEIFNPPLAGSASGTGATSLTPPVRVPVVVGLSDDTTTIVREGVTSGEQVVSRTITGAVTSASSAARSTSVFGGGGAGGAGGGAVRALSR